MHDDPAIDHIQARSDAEDHPPGLADRRGILSRDETLAMGTALGIFVNLPAAIGTRNRRFLIFDFVISLSAVLAKTCLDVCSFAR